LIDWIELISLFIEKYLTYLKVNIMHFTHWSRTQ